MPLCSHIEVFQDSNSVGTPVNVTFQYRGFPDQIPNGAQVAIFTTLDVPYGDVFNITIRIAFEELNDVSMSTIGWKIN